MPYAVTLRLDVASGERVAAMWQALAQRGCSDLPSLGYAPHVTLAVLRDAAEADLVATVLHVARGWRALPVRFPALGVFPGPPAVLFLAPVPDAALLALQRALVAALPAGDLLPHYQPGQFVPHVTLAEDLTSAGVATAFACLQSDWQAFDGTLGQLDVVRFRPVVELMSRPLPP